MWLKISNSQSERLELTVQNGAMNLFVSETNGSIFIPIPLGYSYLHGIVDELMNARDSKDTINHSLIVLNQHGEFVISIMRTVDAEIKYIFNANGFRYILDELQFNQLGKFIMSLKD